MLRSLKKSELVSCLLRHFEQARTTDEEDGAWEKARNWLPRPEDEAEPDDSEADEADEAEAA